MNRRKFLAAVGAVLAAPVAIAKGWFEGKPKLDSDAVVSDTLQGHGRGRFRKVAAQLQAYSLDVQVKAVCDGCGRISMTQKYADFVLLNSATRPNLNCFVLCDTCAEKQGYLCVHRTYVVPDGGKIPCICGKLENRSIWVGLFVT